MDNIGKKLTIGAIWNSISQFGNQGLNFIVTFILAWKLSPGDFGLIGMVTVFTSFFGYFTEFGLTPSLIQKNKIDDTDKSTVFWATLFFSIIIYVCIFFMSPLIAIFYHEDRLIKITRVVFCNFIILPFGFVPETILKKKLSYNVIAKVDLLSNVLSGLIAVIFAFLSFGVWCLVFQMLSKTFVRTLLLNINVKWLPNFRFSVTKFKEHMKFGLFFTMNNLLIYLIDNIDYLIIGRLLGKESLGIYTLAFRISKYPLSKISEVIGKMLFPAFSLIKEDKERMIRSYNKINILTFLVLVAALNCIFFGIESMFGIIGDKWIGVESIVRIFVIYLFFYSLSFSDMGLMIASGRIRNVVVLQFIFAILLVIVGYYSCQGYGLIGMAIAYTILTSLFYILLKVLTFRLLKFDIFKYFRVMFKLLPYLSVMILFGYIIYKIIEPSIVLIIVIGITSTIIIMIQLIVLNILDLKNRKVNLSDINILK